jgi:hypothetical protein
MLIFVIDKITRMSNSESKTLKLNSPVKGCVSYHPRGILSHNLRQGFSITYLLSPLIISSVIEEVLFVVWSEITKSMRRVPTSRHSGICSQESTHNSTYQPIGLN